MTSRNSGHWGPPTLHYYAVPLRVEKLGEWRLDFFTVPVLLRPLVTGRSMVVTEFVIAESILITEAWQENSRHACGSTLRNVVHGVGRTYERQRKIQGCNPTHDEKRIKCPERRRIVSDD